VISVLWPIHPSAVEQLPALRLNWGCVQHQRLRTSSQSTGHCLRAAIIPAASRGESQYALAEFAKRLGWTFDRIIVIDEDQGLSGKSADNRAGFQRLMAEVSLNHVGIVLGLELSRLSRSNKDRHQLVDVCGIFNTLLCDQDGVYDSGDGNDRLIALFQPFCYCRVSDVIPHGLACCCDKGSAF